MSTEDGFYVRPDGSAVGYFIGGAPDDTWILVPSTPEDAGMTWDFENQRWYWKRDVGLRYALTRLNKEFNEAMQGLQTGWPIYEVLTWDKQSTEANAWLAAPADAKPATPFLSSLLEKCLALGAQDTLENLVSRVHANDLQYTEAVTAIMAVRHVAEDQINASDEPMSVTWQFPS